MVFQKAEMHDVHASQGLNLVALQTHDRLRGMGDGLPTPMILGNGAATSVACTPAAPLLRINIHHPLHLVAR